MRRQNDFGRENLGVRSFNHAIIALHRSHIAVSRREEGFRQRLGLNLCRLDESFDQSLIQRHRTKFVLRPHRHCQSFARREYPFRSRW